MIIDIQLRGYRLYLSLDPLQKAKESKPEDSPPTQLSTPMQVRAGFMTWQQIRAASQTEAKDTPR